MPCDRRQIWSDLPGMGIGTSDNMRRVRYGIIEGIGGGINLVLISEHSDWLKPPDVAALMTLYLAFQPRD